MSRYAKRIGLDSIDQDMECVGMFQPATAFNWPLTNEPTVRPLFKSPFDLEIDEPIVRGLKGLVQEVRQHMHTADPVRQDSIEWRRVVNDYLDFRAGKHLGPDATSALRILQSARNETLDGQLLLFEQFPGVVKHRDDVSVSVRYETGDEEFFNQVYGVEQFADGRLPSNGDRVRIIVVLVDEEESASYIEDDDRLLDTQTGSKPRQGSELEGPTSF